MKAKLGLLIFLPILIIGCKNDSNSASYQPTQESHKEPEPSNTSDSKNINDLILNLALKESKIGKCNGEYYRIEDWSNAQHNIHQYRDFYIDVVEKELSEADKINGKKRIFEFTINLNLYRKFIYDEYTGNNGWTEWTQFELSDNPSRRNLLALYRGSYTEYKDNRTGLNDYNGIDVGRFTDATRTDFCGIVAEMTNPGNNIRKNEEIKKQAALDRVETEKFMARRSAVSYYAPIFDDDRIYSACARFESRLGDRDAEFACNNTLQKKLSSIFASDSVCRDIKTYEDLDFCENEAKEFDKMIKEMDELYEKTLNSR